MTPALETYLAEVEAAEGRMTRAPWKNDGGDLWHFGKGYDDSDDQHTYLGISANKPLRNSKQIPIDLDGIALLRNRAKALCGMVRILHDALVTTKSGMGGIDTDIANKAIAAIALIAKGQGEGL